MLPVRQVSEILNKHVSVLMIICEAIQSGAITHKCVQQDNTPSELPVMEVALINKTALIRIKILLLLEDATSFVLIASHWLNHTQGLNR